MIKVTRTTIKPDSKTKLYNIPDDLLRLVASKKEEGKLQTLETIQEGLQVKIIWNWDSLDSYNSYKSTSIYQAVKAARDAYNLANNITTSESIEEVL